MQRPFELPAKPFVIPPMKRQVSTEASKIALVVDTNVLLKQSNLRELLKVPDQNEFDEKFEVYSLDEVIREVRDEQVSNATNSNPFRRRGTTLVTSCPMT